MKCTIPTIPILFKNSLSKFFLKLILKLAIVSHSLSFRGKSFQSFTMRTGTISDRLHL